jgi:hypothetical protein
MAFHIRMPIYIDSEWTLQSVSDRIEDTLLPNLSQQVEDTFGQLLLLTPEDDARIESQMTVSHHSYHRHPESIPGVRLEPITLPPLDDLTHRSRLKPVDSDPVVHSYLAEKITHRLVHLLNQSICLQPTGILTYATLRTLLQHNGYHLLNNINLKSEESM